MTELLDAPLDRAWLAFGAGLVLLAALQSWFAVAIAGAGDAPSVWRRGATLLLDLALASLAVGLAMRWVRLGHGPFIGLYEILASNLLSLGLLWRLGSVRWPVLVPSAPVVMSLLAVLAAWLWVAQPIDTHLPATYEMTVLWFHVALGKFFLGCALAATGLAGVVLARTGALGRRWFAAMPDDARLDALAWRFMLAALVFESLMLVAGAVWAQDAWGRYWDWDPLETWAFLTWLVLSAAVHARITWRIGPRLGSVLVLTVFAIAFFTFFGIPFVSLAPHKGAV
jgi:ABC-type transport system involved in cytochrome c biogenesis permease subunit